MPFAVLAGAAVAVSVNLNAQLGKSLGSPLLAGTISFTIGTVALLAVSVISGEGLPSGAKLNEVEWWAWTGGPFGALPLTAKLGQQ